jgi:copper chaperone NosL
LNAKVLLLVLLSILLVGGCAPPADTSGPPLIAYGQDVCDRCGMIISEEAYAAAYWTKGGEARRFDDIGGMLAYSGGAGEEVASYWVHDFASGEWIRAEEATFVMDADLQTPMGFGIAAFNDEAQAVAMGHGHVDVSIMHFNEMLAMDLTMPLAHGHEMGEEASMAEDQNE